MSAGAMFEEMVLWLAYRDLAEHTSRTPAVDQDPRDAAGRIRVMGDHAISLLHAFRHCDTWPQCEAMLGEILVLLDAGKRPRSMREQGLSREVIEKWAQ